MVDLETYGMKALEVYAAHLNAISVSSPNAEIRYDILADALIWSDETNNATPSDVFDGLRQLLHYRTHVMLNDMEPNGDVWLHCRSLFPDWIGFLPERRKRTPELLALYRRGSVASRWCTRSGQ